MESLKRKIYILNWKEHNSLLLEVIDLNKWSTAPHSEIDFSKLNHALNEFTFSGVKTTKMSLLLLHLLLIN